MTTISTRAEAGEDAGWCDKCHGPVLGRPRWKLALNALAWWFWMRLPDKIGFSRFGFAVLPYVGSHAFSCSCPDRNAAIARSLTDGSE